jgi:hypothetical protein
MDNPWDWRNICKNEFGYNDTVFERRYRADELVYYAELPELLQAY